MKTGKIFPESENLCQDEAKVLFNYYRKAAEKIVAEEERLEQEIAALEEERSQLEEEKGKLWVWWLTIVLFFMYFIKKSNIDKKIESIQDRIREFKNQHDEIFRDYSVSKLGVAYVPVAGQVRYEDSSFIVDYTGSAPEREVVLQQSRHNELLVETVEELGKLVTEAPIVETSADAEKVETDDYSLSIQEIYQNDYLGALERSLRTISYCMNDLETASVALPFVMSDSKELKELREFGTDSLPEGAKVVNVFNSSRFEESEERFKQLNGMMDSLSTETQQFEDVLKSLMTNMARSVQGISALKVASVDKIVVDSNSILFQILKSPYNHYSPTLEAEEIERIRHERFDFSDSAQGYEPFTLRKSSRMKYDPISGIWVAEEGSSSATPFGVHQLYEEIVAPVVQNLMEETRIERLKIYNHIKDQKLSYLTKWHQDTEAFYRANRAESSDIINLMQESLRQYVAAYNTLISLQRTEESMASEQNLESTVVESVENSQETLAAFELQSQEFQKIQTEFEDYMERLKEDIDQKAENFGHVEYYDAKLRDGYSNEVATAAVEAQDLDERRRNLAAINPLFAKESELPPQPKVSDITFEHLALNLPSIARAALKSLDPEAEEAPEATAPEATATATSEPAGIPPIPENL